MTALPSGEALRPEDTWGDHTRRGVEVLGVSGRTLGSCPPLMRALALVKIATARANADAGVIDHEVADALVAAATDLAIGSVDPAELPADLLAGGGSIAVHMNVNEVLASRADRRLTASGSHAGPVDPKAHASASQSTADVCHTAVRLAIIVEARKLIDAVERLVASLRSRAAELAAIPTLARTCLRDATTAPLSTVLSGSADALHRRIGGLRTTLGPLHDVVLGGTVIGLGTGAPAAYRACVVIHLGDAAGMSLRPHLAPSSALQHGDDLAAVSSSLAQLSQVLLKLGADLRLLASGPRGGFGELELPAVLAGSSFFAGKQNPVVAETLIQSCLQVQGYAHTAELATGRAELYLQVHDGLVAVNVLDGLALLTHAVDRTDRYAIHGLQADEERCRWLAGLAHRPESDPAEPNR